MEKRKRSLILIGIVLFLGLIYGVFLRGKITHQQCKIQFSDRTLVLVWERPGLQGWPEGYLGEVGIESRSGPFGLRSEKLIEGEVGGGLLENEPCSHFQQNGNEILILSQFYSSDRGKSFFSLNNFLGQHQAATGQSLGVAYPELTATGLRMAYSLSDSPGDSVIFLSRDGAQTWEKVAEADF